MTDMNEYPAQVQHEITEKIIIGLEHVTPNAYASFSGDLVHLLTVGMEESGSYDERWDQVNMVLGYHLNKYLPKNKTFPEHVMEVLEEARKI